MIWKEKMKKLLKSRKKSIHKNIFKINKNGLAYKNVMKNYKKTLDNVPSEFKGQAGELMLFDELHKAFPQDNLIQKTNGV